MLTTTQRANVKVACIILLASTVLFIFQLIERSLYGSTLGLIGMCGGMYWLGKIKITRT